MEAQRTNVMKWFAKIFGILLFLLLAAEIFFDLLPVELTTTKKWVVAIVAGVLVFGNPKTFFSQLGNIFLDKARRK